MKLVAMYLFAALAGSGLLVSAANIRQGNSDEKVVDADSRDLGSTGRCGDSCDHDWECGYHCPDCHHGECTQRYDNSGHDHKKGCGDRCYHDWECGHRCPDCRYGECRKSPSGSRGDHKKSCGDSCDHDRECGYRCPDCRHGECKQSRYEGDWDGPNSDGGYGEGEGPHDGYDDRYRGDEGN